MFWGERVVGAGLAVLLVTVACKSQSNDGGPAPTSAMPPAQSKQSLETNQANSASWRETLTKVCELPAASPASVQQQLGLSDSLAASSPQTWGDGHMRCQYKPPGSIAGDVAIEVETKVSSLQTSREMMEKAIGKTDDYPGFGDEAFSGSLSLGPKVPPVNTLAVRKKDILMIVTASAPLDKMQALAAAVLGQMGI